MTALPSNGPRGSAAIHGIGVDLLRIARMERAFARHGERLFDKLLCAEERSEVRRRPRIARALAMCFAAKEAMVKALGTGFSGVGYKDAGVLRDDAGRPYLVFSPGLRARLDAEGIGAAHVSLTDDNGMVCAFVVLETAAGS